MKLYLAIVEWRSSLKGKFNFVIQFKFTLRALLICEQIDICVGIFLICEKLIFLWEYFFFVKILFRYYWLTIAVHNSKSFTLISGPSLMCWKCRKFVHKLAKFSGSKLDAQKCSLLSVWTHASIGSFRYSLSQSIFSIQILKTWKILKNSNLRDSFQSLKCTVNHSHGTYYCKWYKMLLWLYFILKPANANTKESH